MRLRDRTTSDDSCPWTTVATEGARDTRNGPSLGYTKVGVPIEFTQAGTYCVRGIVTHVREVLVPSIRYKNRPSDALLATDTDVVLVKVRVLGSGKPQGALTADPEVIYTAPMPNTSDTKSGTEKDTKADPGR